MAITKPQINLLSHEKRFLQILEKFLLSALEETNRDDAALNLTNAEQAELFVLVQLFSESRKFRQTAFLIESLFQKEEVVPYSALQGIYTKNGGVDSGRNPWARHHWIDFNARIGNLHRQPNQSNNTQPMEFDHFLKMEHLLFKEAKLPAPVVELLIDEVGAQKKTFEDLNSRGSGLKQNILYQLISQIPETLRSASLTNWANQPIETKRAAGVLTIVTNLSVVYTTRDWSTAGFFSTMAGASIATVGK